MTTGSVHHTFHEVKQMEITSIHLVGGTFSPAPLCILYSWKQLLLRLVPRASPQLSSDITCFLQTRPAEVGLVKTVILPWSCLGRQSCRIIPLVVDFGFLIEVKLALYPLIAKSTSASTRFGVLPIKFLCSRILSSYSIALSTNRSYKSAVSKETTQWIGLVVTVLDLYLRQCWLMLWLGETAAFQA